MKISHILSASVLAGAVLLSTTACFSSEGKEMPANPATSSSSTAAPDSSETVAPEYIGPIPDSSMSANAEGQPDLGAQSGVDSEAENPGLVLTPEPDPMPTS